MKNSQVIKYFNQLEYIFKIVVNITSLIKVNYYALK